MRRPVWFTLLVLLGVAVDALSKTVVFHYLRPDERALIIPGVLEIVRAQNTGVAFSLLVGRPIFILAVDLAFIVGAVWVYIKYWRVGETLAILALGLLLIGAVGNLSDRLWFHYVRDFIDFVPRLPLIGHWAIFNIADACIVASVVLFLVQELFLKKRRIG